MILLNNFYAAKSKNGRKSIKKLMTDEKIPARVRNEYRVFAIGSDVLWILQGRDGIPVLDRIGNIYKIDKSTKKVLEISII